jgi:2-methylisocitrate lyase-like PEP mutase family enzyme
MTTQQEMCERFAALHARPEPFVIANAWDAGAAKVFASLGFEAIATTSSGHAATLGRLDGRVSRDEALEHARVLAAATELPVSSDLENAFADDPAGVAQTIGLAVQTGLAGCSVEDYSRADDKIYDAALAKERVEAAAEAAHAGPARLVLTARAENFLHGRRDLADTIARLQSFQEAGADVLFAPGVRDADDLRQLIASVDRPVNVIAVPGVPTVAELGALGAKRISVGGGLYYVALGAVVEAARALHANGTYDYWQTAGIGMQVAHEVFAT